MFEASSLAELVKEWAGAITAFGAALSALGLNRLWAWLRDRSSERRADNARDTFRLGFQLSNVMNELRLRLNCHRSMIIIAHNGGNDIDIRKPLYTTVFRQVTDDKLPQVLWEREPVDEGYWQLLKRLVDVDESGVMKLEVRELDPHSTLRALYENQGVVRAYIFELDAHGDEYWYVSTVQTDGDEPPSESNLIDACRSAKSEMRRILVSRKLVE